MHNFAAQQEGTCIDDFRHSRNGLARRLAPLTQRQLGLFNIRCGRWILNLYRSCSFDFIGRRRLAHVPDRIQYEEAAKDEPQASKHEIAKPHQPRSRLTPIRLLWTRGHTTDMARHS